MREIKKIVFTRWESDFNIKINRNRNEIQCDAVTKVVERKYQQQNSEETKIRIFESHDLNWIDFLSFLKKNDFNVNVMSISQLNVYFSWNS